MHLRTNDNGHKLQAITRMNEKTQNLKCRNPSLGLTIKARVCKGASQEEARESHLMLPGV